MPHLNQSAAHMTTDLCSTRSISGKLTAAMLTLRAPARQWQGRSPSMTIVVTSLVCLSGTKHARYSFWTHMHWQCCAALPDSNMAPSGVTDRHLTACVCPCISPLPSAPYADSWPAKGAWLFTPPRLCAPPFAKGRSELDCCEAVWETSEMPKILPSEQPRYNACSAGSSAAACTAVGRERMRR